MNDYVTGPRYLNKIGTFNAVLKFVTDDVSIMRCKGVCGNLLNARRKINVLHLVMDIIQQCYPEVDALITSTKLVFLKSPKRTRQFQTVPIIPVQHYSLSVIPFKI